MQHSRTTGSSSSAPHNNGGNTANGKASAANNFAGYYCQASVSYPIEKRMISTDRAAKLLVEASSLVGQLSFRWVAWNRPKSGELFLIFNGNSNSPNSAKIDEIADDGYNWSSYGKKSTLKCVVAPTEVTMEVTSYGDGYLQGESFVSMTKCRYRLLAPESPLMLIQYLSIADLNSSMVGKIQIQPPVFFPKAPPPVSQQQQQQQQQINNSEQSIRNTVNMQGMGIRNTTPLPMGIGRSISPNQSDVLSMINQSGRRPIMMGSLKRLSGPSSTPQPGLLQYSNIINRQTNPNPNNNIQSLNQTQPQLASLMRRPIMLKQQQQSQSQQATPQSNRRTQQQQPAAANNDEDEDLSGDEYDLYSPKDLSLSRYQRNHEFLGEIFSSVTAGEISPAANESVIRQLQANLEALKNQKIIIEKENEVTRQQNNSRISKFKGDSRNFKHNFLDQLDNCDSVEELEKLAKKFEHEYNVSLYQFEGANQYPILKPVNLEE